MFYNPCDCYDFMFLFLIQFPFIYYQSDSGLVNVTQLVIIIPPDHSTCGKTIIIGTDYTLSAFPRKNEYYHYLGISLTSDMFNNDTE